MHFRFRITQPDHSETFTDWQEEKVKYGEGASAVQAIKNVRREHPDASIGIERIPGPPTGLIALVNERGPIRLPTITTTFEPVKPIRLIAGEGGDLIEPSGGAMGTIQVDVDKKSATVNLISPKPVKPE